MYKYIDKTYIYKYNKLGHPRTHYTLALKGGKPFLEFCTNFEPTFCQYKFFEIVLTFYSSDPNNILCLSQVFHLELGC